VAVGTRHVLDLKASGFCYCRGNGEADEASGICIASRLRPLGFDLKASDIRQQRLSLCGGGGARWDRRLGLL
jgi:hypothetical protein